LRSRGFEAKKVMVDPHKSFQALQGSFPGVEIDPTRAGDHLDKIDTKIRRLKELMRSVISGIPYRLAKERIKDLVTYSVCRMNLRGTDMLVSNECPRVRFTGQRPEYATELGLAFGDYVEAYNPRAQLKSNDIISPRTEPCIALYPAANTNGSWVVFNLNTQSYVRRSQWKKCPMPVSVITIMNGLAGETGVQTADIITQDEVATEDRMHVEMGCWMRELVKYKRNRSQIFPSWKNGGKMKMISTTKGKTMIKMKRKLRIS
jgi:hypothetical protein